MTGNVGYTGQRTVTSGTSRFNALQFMIRAFTGGMATATMVEVVGVHGGGLDGPPTIDVLLLVNQVDALGNSTPHGIVCGLPVFRYQAGTSAVVLDPVVGDIGMAAFASRDISIVKATKAQSNPGSYRRFDYADGMYLGSFLGQETTQYVEFLSNGGGINVLSPGPITVTAGTTATVTAKDVVVHGSHSVSSDVNGYGSRITFEGGSDFTEDTYTTGAVVTTTERGWTPPDIPSPS